MRISVFDRFDSVYNDWEKLIENSQSSPFISAFWQNLWWDNFGEGDLALIKIFDDQEVIGIVPLYLNGNIARFIGGTDLFDYQDFIFKKGFEEKAIKTFLSHVVSLNWNEIELLSIPEDSLNIELLERLSKDYGFLFEISVIETSPVKYLPETWDEYIAGLSKKNRHELRRKFKRIQNEGYEFYICEESDLQNSLSDFFRLHKLSSVDKSDFMSAERETFFTEIAINHMKNNQLSLSFVEMNGVRVASSFCFDYGDSTFLYNSGYDKDFSSFSVGFICNALAIKSSIDKGKKTFDFLRGDERYKYHLGGIDKSVYKITLSKK